MFAKNLSRRREIEMSALAEFGLRFGLLLVFIYTEVQFPFVRKIQKEEIYLYMNPRIDSYVPTSTLWPMVTLVPLVTILATYMVTGNGLDAGVATLLVTLLMPVNGVITNVIKLAVGRPRPDFMYRCFPPKGQIPMDAFFSDQLPCTGDLEILRDGRKSFPSGHSSFAFATFGFVFFYLSGKMKTFAPAQKGSFGDSYRILVSLFILLVPTLVAISRTCDYHHHWQDVSVGSLLGFVLSWCFYRFYYPPLTSANCDKPYAALRHHHNKYKSQNSSSLPPFDDIESMAPLVARNH